MFWPISVLSYCISKGRNYHFFVLKDKIRTQVLVLVVPLCASYMS